VETVGQPLSGPAAEPSVQTEEDKLQKEKAKIKKKLRSVLFY